MATIVTRAGKGSALTWTEGDANITNLNNELATKVASVTGTAGRIAVGGTATAPTVDLATAGAGAGSYGGTALTAITLDAYGRVTAVTAGTPSSATTATNINISTNTGNNNDTTLSLVMVASPTTGSQAPHIDTSLSWDATNNDLTLGSASATNSAGIILYASGGGTHTIQASSSASNLTALTLPATNGAANSILQNNGSGQLSWATAFSGNTSGTHSGTINTTNPATINGTTANSPKLTIGTGALSSTAWTTTGIGLRISAATYTDTSSLAGTVAASHPHAIAVPTIASTNIITVTDAGTLYVAGPPTAGTNTTITNGWAILANGAVKATSFTGSGAGLTSIPNSALSSSAITFGATSQALGSTVSALNSVAIGSTTASTGAFTTLSASSTVSGTGFSNYLASPPAIGGTTAAAITGTTITANTQFSGPHNGTVGATTPNTGAFTTLSSSGLTTANSLSVTTNATLKDIRETVAATLTYAATITPDVANGTIQKITLTGNVTFSAFANPVAGQSMTLIVTQDATGGRTLTSTMKFSGGSKTLSTAANSVDIISVFYDGSTYYASLGKGFA